MLLNIFFVLVGFALLVVGGEFLVRTSVALSFKFHISKMVIGLTVVSFATSVPELLVSVQAALDGYSDIALGNVIGSNIANIGFVLGITAVISPFTIDRGSLKFPWSVMMLISLGLYFILRSGEEITSIEGFALVAMLCIYLFMLIHRAKKGRNKENIESEVDESLSKVSNFKIIVWLLIGGVSLYAGSELLVKGAVNLARVMEISERVIAVTMIAVGTSIPEFSASVIAALKKEKAISLGNLIGSNIFNIASVLGITAIIQPIAIKSHEVLSNDIIWMLSFSFVVLPLALLPKRFEIGRLKGLIIVSAYVLFIGLVFLS